MHILYLSYDGLTDPLGQSQVLPYIMGLAQRGYRFTIISTEKKEAYQKRRQTIEALIEPLAAVVDWQPIFYTKKPPVLSTLRDIRQMRQKAIALHQKHAFDVVHCRSYVTALTGSYLKQTQGIPFVFDMRGFWADERVEGGLWNLKNPVFKAIYQYFKRKEKAFLRLADYTVSLTFNARDEIHSWAGLQHIPIQVIPCCVDSRLFDPASLDLHRMQEWKQKLGIQSSDFVLSYLGSLGTWYLAEDMLRFFKQLKQAKPNARFLMITPDDPQLVLEKAAQVGLQAEDFVFQQAERRDVPYVLQLSQVSLMFIKPSFSKKASSPTKTGEILAMGIPVISNTPIGDTEYLQHAYPDVPLLTIRELSETAYQGLIQQLQHLLAKGTPEERLTHARSVALDYFDLQKGIQLYTEVYQQVEAKKTIPV